MHQASGTVKERKFHDENDLFDVLNAKLPAAGICKNSMKIQVMGVLMLVVCCVILRAK